MVQLVIRKDGLGHLDFTPLKPELPTFDKVIPKKLYHLREIGSILL